MNRRSFLHRAAVLPVAVVVGTVVGSDKTDLSTAKPNLYPYGTSITERTVAIASAYHSGLISRATAREYLGLPEDD